MTTEAPERPITLDAALGVLNSLSDDQRASLLLTDHERFDLVERLASDNLKEIGATGTTFFGGFLDGEEYNKDLAGDAGIRVFRQMGASDGTVKAMLRILTLPMQASQLVMQPATDSDEDKQIAEATLHALQSMEGMTWDSFVRQAFKGGLQYGFAVFEPVYERPDGSPNLIEWSPDADKKATDTATASSVTLLAPYKLAPRLQKTIYRFIIDKIGDLRAVQQLTFQGDLDPEEPIIAGESSKTFAQGNGGTQKYITIPSERLFVLVFDQEGSNYRGESALRSAYKHWFYKENIMRMLAVGIERHMVGVPYAVLKQGISPIEQGKILSALKTVRSHEKGYIVVNEAQLANSTSTGLPSIGFLQMPTLGANGKMANDTIQMQDRMMVLSILADFLALGSGLGGNSNVMHRDKTSYFFLALQGYATTFLDALRSQVVKQFVDLNFPQANGHYPKPELQGIETKDPFALAEAVSKAIVAGALRGDAQIENMLRETLGLPLLPTNDEGEPIYPEDAEDYEQEFQTGPDGKPLLGPDGKPLPKELPSSLPGPTTGSGEQGGNDVQALALNGTQISSLLELITLVADSQIPPQAAKALIRASFPSLDEKLINEMVDSAVSFTPKPPEPPVLPPGALPSNRQLPQNTQRQQPPARPPSNVQQRLTEALRLLDENRSEEEIKALELALGVKIKRHAKRLAENDDYLQEDFVKDSHRDLLAAFGVAFLIGQREQAVVAGPVSKRDAERWAVPEANQQQKFLQNFASDIAVGQLSEAQADARADLYTGLVYSGYNRGRVSVLPDESTIVWNAEPDCCELCDNRDGQEYTEDTLPGFPGDGDFGELCMGGPQCRCSLELHRPSNDNSDTSVKLLAEARCPACNRLVARNVNVGAELECRDCRVNTNGTRNRKFAAS